MSGSARGAAWTGIGIGISSLATFGASAFIVAVSGPAEFSDFAVLTVIAMVIGTFCRMGADRFAVAEINASRVDSSQRGADIIALVIVAGLLGAALLQSPPASRALAASLSHPPSRLELLAVGVWLFGDVVRLVGAEILRAAYRFRLAAATSYGARGPLFLGLLLLSWSTGGGHLTRSDILVDAAIASAVVCIVSVVTAIQFTALLRAHPFRSARRIWTGHVSMLLTTFAATLVGGGDIWIMGATAPPDVTASYAFAVTLVGGLSLLATAITGGVLPYLATALANGDVAAVQAQIARYVRVAGVAAIGIYLALVLLAEPLVVLLGGSSYQGITRYVVILGLGQVVNALAGVSGAVLIAARRYGLLMAVTVSVTLAALTAEILAGFVISSVLGVCIASAIATAILPVVGAIAVKRTTGIRTDALAPARPVPL